MFVHNDVQLPKTLEIKLVMAAVSYFHVFISGQIESAKFPLGPDGSQVFCRYEITAGADWEHISGVKTGITQCSVPGANGDDEIVFNMPLEVSFKSTNPFGWPQLIISIYGRNIWGAETALGYARVHLPIFGGHFKSAAVPIILPRCTNLMAELSSWITGKNPELKSPKILAEGTKSKGLQTESYGEIILSLRTISRGSNQMGYDWGQD